MSPIISGGGGGGGGGSQTLVDLGTVNIVDLLNGPQTLYTPAMAFVIVTYNRDTVAPPDHQALYVIQDPAPYPADPTRLLGIVASGVLGIPGGRPLGSKSSIPIVAGLVTQVSGYFVDEALESWQANHVYADKTCILGPDNHIWSSSAGTSAGTIPDFAANEGGSVVDNTVIWTDEGAVPTVGSVHLYAIAIGT